MYSGQPVGRDRSRHRQAHRGVPVLVDQRARVELERVREQQQARRGRFRHEPQLVQHLQPLDPGSQGLQARLPQRVGAHCLRPTGQVQMIEISFLALFY